MAAQWHGILPMDKPEGMSSHGMVDRVRRILGTRRVGHGGTLDPLATGLLLILLGDATKSCSAAMAGDKDYDATVRLGFSTATDDREGEALERGHFESLDRESIERALGQFLGEREQIPPQFCARKIQGVPCYRRGRSGQAVAIAGRVVRVDRLALLDWNAPLLRLSIGCSPGTYVRSIARDLGRVLGCPAHLHRLRRTRSGCFTVAGAWDLAELAGREAGPIAEEMEKNWQLLREKFFTFAEKGFAEAEKLL
ncbi:MAG: tRNA pseudouridine(55) synthase TruB [Puniceicoccales bacterium]|jgi:tRNA pseudouridine55 synthase|nr:tRNA pseudouridine(55) synthase TruB [Puniceicoccales bacterium]